MEEFCSTLTNLPTDKDANDQCKKDSSNKSDVFLFGPSPYSQQLALELKCSRHSCFHVLLYYYPTNEYNDCSNDFYKSFKFKAEYSMTCNSSFPEYNLSPGFFCVRYTEYGIQESKIPCYRKSFYTNMFELRPKPTTAIPTPPPLPPNTNLIYLAIIPLSLAAFIIITACIIQFKTGNVLEIPIFVPLMKYSVFDAMQKTKPIKVFILYSRDCIHHQRTAETLAKFLLFNNCLVTLSMWDIHHLATNPIGYTSEKLSGQYKVILVLSRQCFEAQHAYYKNDTQSMENGTLEDRFFLSALIMIMQRTQQALDYRHLFVVRPEYVSTDFVLRDVCPGRQYVLPKHADLLLCHLHNINSERIIKDDDPDVKWGEVSSEYRDLCECIENVKNGNRSCRSCFPSRKEETSTHQ
ncbi:hypothetical protein CHUAL_005612 [Chamberlinius hualienensis]